MSAYSDLILGTTGLVGYWRLGETSGTVAEDAFSTNDGEYVNSPTLGESGAINIDSDKSVRFNGNVWVRNGSAALNIVGNKITLEAWVYRMAGSADHQIIAKAGPTTSSANRKFGLYISNADKVGCEIKTADGHIDFTTTYTPAGFVWLHIVGVYDGSNIKVYVNGSLVGTSGSLTGNIVSNTEDMKIGIFEDNVSKFNGKIDEVAVYDTDLSAATILSHYEAGVGSLLETVRIRESVSITLSGTTKDIVLLRENVQVFENFQAARKNVTDRVRLRENKLREFGKPKTDTVRLIEAISVTKTREPHNEIVRTSDTLVRSFTNTDSYTDIVRLVERATAIREVSRPATDIIRLSDFIEITLFKTPFDRVIVKDTLSNFVWAWGRTKTETVRLIEKLTTSRGGPRITNNLSEIIVIRDTVNVVIEKRRPVEGQADILFIRDSFNITKTTNVYDEFYGDVVLTKNTSDEFNLAWELFTEDSTDDFYAQVTLQKTNVTQDFYGKVKLVKGRTRFYGCGGRGVVLAGSYTGPRTP